MSDEKYFFVRKKRTFELRYKVHSGNLGVLHPFWFVSHFFLLSTLWGDLRTQITECPLRGPTGFKKRVFGDPILRHCACVFFFFRLKKQKTPSCDKPAPFKKKNQGPHFFFLVGLDVFVLVCVCRLLSTVMGVL